MSMKVAMIGLGKLGLPVSVAMAKNGAEVAGFDVNARLADEIEWGSTGLYEPGLQEDLKDVIDSGALRVARSFEDAVRDSEIIFKIGRASCRERV